LNKERDRGDQQRELWNDGRKDMIVNLLSWSLVEGANRADFGANPFTNATSATTTRNRVVEAYIVGEWTGFLKGNE